MFAESLPQGDRHHRRVGRRRHGRPLHGHGRRGGQGPVDGRGDLRRRPDRRREPTGRPRAADLPGLPGRSPGPTRGGQPLGYARPGARRASRTPRRGAAIAGVRSSGVR
jgi:hypothetical protein